MASFIGTYLFLFALWQTISAMPSSTTSPSVRAVPVHACSEGSFKQPQVFGTQIISISAAEVLNYTLNPFSITNLNFCQINVTYTHPGHNDTVQVQVWLPLTGYNLRFQAVGGGGYSAFGGDINMPPPTKQGYATASTNAGLDNNALSPAGWALTSPGNVNYNLLTNYGYISLDELLVIGKAVTASFYGSPLEYSYFTGCSNGRILPENSRFPTSSNHHFRLLSTGFALPGFHFQLFTSGFPLKLFALCLKRRIASIPTLASKGNPLSCKIADEFKDDLNDDSVRKGCQSIERSTVLARQTAMT